MNLDEVRWVLMKLNEAGWSKMKLYEVLEDEKDDKKSQTDWKIGNVTKKGRITSKDANDWRNDRLICRSTRSRFSCLIFALHAQT